MYKFDAENSAVLISENVKCQNYLPVDRKNGILVEPKFKKVFSMFFLCFM